MPSVYEFIPTVEGQAGDRYVFGAEASFGDSDPDAFDCSELVQWGCARIGVTAPDGAANQWDWCRRQGTVLSVADGIATFGALLFRITPPHNHVVVSLGNGQTFEARGAAYGVNYFTAAGRTWTGAGRIPGLDYSPRNLQLEDADMALTAAEIQAAARAGALEALAAGIPELGGNSVIGLLRAEMLDLPGQPSRQGRQGRDLGRIKPALGLSDQPTQGEDPSPILSALAARP